MRKIGAAGKAHTGIEGADCLVTYNSNGRNLEIVQQRGDVYRPHCLAVDSAPRPPRGNLLS